MHIKVQVKNIIPLLLFNFLYFCLLALLSVHVLRKDVSHTCAVNLVYHHGVSS